GSNRAVAVTGSERFRDALVRSLLVEAVTLHGPVDLDLVVLTDPDRLSGWDWAKWLPHLRQGGRLDGPPAIWSSRHDIGRWSEASHLTPPDPTPHPSPPSTPASTPSHLTLVILDDPGLWNRRDAPARSIVSTPPDHVRLIALCDDERQAPAICTTVISETDDDLARIHSLTRDDDEVFRPALTEPGIAVRVARALAPLADVDLAPPTTPAVADANRIALPALVGATEVDHVLTRWAADDPLPTAAIGRRGHEFIEVPVAADVTVVVGSSMGDAFDVAATWLVAQCVERSPDALWVAPMVLGHSPRSELLWRLPHATDRHDVDSTIEPRRLLARLRAVLADPAGPVRIVVVTEAPGGAATSPGETRLTTLAAGVRDISGLTMVVVTDRPEMADLLGDTVIRVERRYDEPGTARRVAVLATGDGPVGEPFTPLQPTTSATADVELRPFVVGRALTPLERRIEQHRALTSNSPSPAFDTIIALLRDAASRRHADAPAATTDGRTVVPPPIPTRVDLDELFANSPGDGVPIGLVDDPDHAGVRTRWWEPGSGSMLVFGSRRSGMEQAITTILLGAIDRFSELDVRLVVVESSSARRRAFADLDHPVRVVDPDHSDELRDALDEVTAELGRCAVTDAAVDHDGPRMVLLIGDLVHLRRRYADQPMGTQIDEVVTRAAAPGSGVDVIAAAADLEGAGPFATVAASRLVGASSNHRELETLGVEYPSDVDGIVGRCQSFPDGDLVQLATTDDPIEMLLARRSTGGAA
ncbi:MAG TPA: hypothetical protein VLN74_13475, partial [Ilumatobacteraceae bacterium]|nr:hypothetical protein [Ilumatobacteraceae bacterium]